MRLCTFEDARVAGLEPLAAARPAFDLRCGLTTLLEKQLRAVRPTAVGAFVRPHLARAHRPRPPALAGQRVGLAGRRPGRPGQRPLAPAACGSQLPDRRAVRRP